MLETAGEASLVTYIKVFKKAEQKFRYYKVTDDGMVEIDENTYKAEGGK